MKKIFTLIIILALTVTGFAQLHSSLRPTLVVWNVDGKNVSLRRALYGINQPDKLKLEVYFRQADLQRYKNRPFKLEFRWFYYLSTRKKFIKSQVVTLSDAQQLPKGLVKFTTTMDILQPGWWEVRIVNLADHRYIAYANLDKFQIMLRRPVYVRR